MSKLNDCIDLFSDSERATDCGWNHAPPPLASLDGTVASAWITSISSSIEAYDLDSFCPPPARATRAATRRFSSLWKASCFLLRLWMNATNAAINARAPNKPPTTAPTILPLLLPEDWLAGFASELEFEIEPWADGELTAGVADELVGPVVAPLADDDDGEIAEPDWHSAADHVELSETESIKSPLCNVLVEDVS